MDNVPKIRFNGFEEAWTEIKLSDIGNIVTGTTPSTIEDENYNGDFLFVSPADINENRYIISTKTTLSEKGFLLGRILRSGTTLFVSIGSTIGKTAQLLSKATTNQQINAIVPFENYNDDFVFSLMSNRSTYIRGLAATQAVPIINKTNFSNINTLITDNLYEQSQIGNFFQNIDSLITAQQSKIYKLKNIKSAYLEKMFPKKGSTTPEIRFKGFREKWKQKRLGDMGITYSGLSGKTKEDFGFGDAEYVTYMNVFSNTISDRVMTDKVEVDAKQNKVEFGDIFFTVSSETPEEVGMSSIWLHNDNNKDIYLNSFCFGYRLTYKVNPYYIAYLLRSPLPRNSIILLAQGISRYNISKNKVMNIEVLLPSIEEEQEQEKIGDFFKKLDELIYLNESKLTKLKNVKASFLSKMFVTKE